MGAIDDVGSPETVVGVCESAVAVVPEFCGVMVLCVILTLAQSSGAAWSVWLSALTLGTML